MDRKALSSDLVLLFWILKIEKWLQESGLREIE